MVYWIKQLPHKCEDLSSDSQTLCKAGCSSMDLQFQCSHGEVGTGRKKPGNLQQEQ